MAFNHVTHGRPHSDRLSHAEVRRLPITISLEVFHPRAEKEYDFFRADHETLASGPSGHG